MTWTSIHTALLSSKRSTYCRVCDTVLIDLYPVFRRSVISTLVVFQSFLPKLANFGSPRFRGFIVDILPFDKVKRLRDIINIMHETPREILEAKKRALQEGDEAVARQIARGQDIISTLSMCDPNVLPLGC